MPLRGEKSTMPAILDFEAGQATDNRLESQHPWELDVRIAQGDFDGEDEDADDDFDEEDFDDDFDDDFEEEEDDGYETPLEGLQDNKGDRKQSDLDETFFDE
jgi:hypothetical protein